MREAKVWTWEELRGLLIPSGACLLWPRPQKNGYGTVSHRGKVIGAHKLAYVLTKGPVEAGLFVCHNCPGGDNPACCNPAHLWLGTARENWEDMIRKGRGQSIEHIGKRSKRGPGKKRAKPAPKVVLVPLLPPPRPDLGAICEALELARMALHTSRLLPREKDAVRVLMQIAEEVIGQPAGRRG